MKIICLSVFFEAFLLVFILWPSVDSNAKFSLFSLVMVESFVLFIRR